MTQDCQHVWKITEATPVHITRSCIHCSMSNDFPATADILLLRFIEAEEQHLLRYQQLAETENARDRDADQLEEARAAMQFAADRLKAYPNNPAARNAIKPQAKCRNAK